MFLRLKKFLPWRAENIFFNAWKILNVEVIGKFLFRLRLFILFSLGRTAASEQILLQQGPNFCEKVVVNSGFYGFQKTKAMNNFFHGVMHIVCMMQCD